MEILHINLISQRREPSIGKLQLKMELCADMCLKLSDGLLKSISLPLFAGRSKIKGLSEEETCQQAFPFMDIGIINKLFLSRMKQIDKPFLSWVLAVQHVDKLFLSWIDTF